MHCLYFWKGINAMFPLIAENQGVSGGPNLATPKEICAIVPSRLHA